MRLSFRTFGCVGANRDWYGRSAFVEKLVLELGVGAGTSHDDVRPMELFVNAGYRFIPRMYVFAHAGGMFGLGEKTGGTRAYTRTPLLGGGLGYTLCSGDGVALDVRGSAHRVWARPTERRGLRRRSVFACRLVRL